MGYFGGRYERGRVRLMTEGKKPPDAAHPGDAIYGMSESPDGAWVAVLTNF